MTNRTTKLLWLGASALAFAPLLAGSAFAQSTGTQEIETVVVSGSVISNTGLMTPIDIPKERSIVSKEFIDTQPAGQTVFDTLNTIPGFNFTNTDPYGNSGGNIRLHGMDGNRISLTWDGMPLNDTGNYATFTNQIVDTEIIDRVSVNQGTTDVDSPTASSTGGVINILTTKPADTFSAMTDLSVGSDNYRRGFFRVDSGEIGPWGTRAFATYSYTMYDKFKGPGNLQKRQINADIYQDMGALGWLNIAAHFNNNRNDFYNNVSFLPVNTAFAYQRAPGPVTNTTSPTGVLATVADGGANVSSPNVALDANGDFAGVIPLNGQPVPIGGFGLNFDEDPVCNRATPVTGTVQSDASCTGFYHIRINPSDTGNIRASSLWHLTQDLTFTLDANFQYVLANGGGFTNVFENDAKLRGSTPGPAALAFPTAAATALQHTTPFGCVPGFGCDLNGDGDLNDSVGEYTPNTTNTRRYGVNAQMIYALNDQNTFQFAYVLDWGLHRQTGLWSTFGVNGPNSVWGGLDDVADRVKAADGFALRQRDRKSYAILNQFSFDYEGRFFADSLRISAGVRLPFFERELHQFCYNQTTGFAYCTTETPTTTPALTAVGLVQFAGAGATAFFTAPGTETVNYSRTLPNAGIAWLPWGPAHQFFATYAQGISVPRTDNLYNGGTNGDPACHVAAPPAPAPCKYTTFENDVRPETTATYDIGYRFTGDWLTASITAWNTQYRNRVVTTFDPDQGISVDHNIGTVNMDGVDVEGTISPMDGLDIYQSVSYLHSRVAPGPFAILVPGTNPLVTVSIAGKEVLETPNWTESTRLQYKIAGFRIGLGGKFVGRRFATDNNDFRLDPYFTANADVTYDLGELGWDNSYLKFNVSNLFDTPYFSSVGTSKNCFTPYAASQNGGHAVTVGCTAYPLLSVGAPRTLQIELRAAL
jgi:iron complex outermembrane receptor protein